MFRKETTQKGAFAFAGAFAVLLALVAALTCIGFSPANAYAAEEEDADLACTTGDYLQRLAGADRYGTMDQIARETFTTSEWAIIASGENFPDALAAGSLAGELEAPIILTPKATLCAEAEQLLIDLGVTNVYILGGTAAIEQGVEDSIVDMGIEVTRLGGADRQETAVLVFNEVNELADACATETETTEATVSCEEESSDCDCDCDCFTTANAVIIATGANFADALSVSPYSYYNSIPVLLTQTDGTLSDDTIAAIEDSEVNQVIIVGGVLAVSEDVIDQLGGKYAYAFTRIAGADRYDTSKQIAMWSVIHGSSYTTVAIATGENYPDALAGGAIAGIQGGVLTLVCPDDATAASSAMLSSLPEQVYILGGPAAVDGDTANLATLGALGFYQSLGDNGTAAVAACLGSELTTFSSYTNYGAVNDATYLKNVQKSVAYIKACNELRTGGELASLEDLDILSELGDIEGIEDILSLIDLDSLGCSMEELSVSPYLMAVSNILANWGNACQTAPTYNIAMNYTWDSEWNGVSPYDKWSADTESYIRYMNPLYNVTGFSVCYGSAIHDTEVQTFGASLDICDSITLVSDAIDIDEFSELLDAYCAVIEG